MLVGFAGAAWGLGTSGAVQLRLCTFLGHILFVCFFVRICGISVGFGSNSYSNDDKDNFGYKRCSDVEVGWCVYVRLHVYMVVGVKTNMMVGRLRVYQKEGGYHRRHNPHFDQSLTNVPVGIFVLVM